jgi:hypothetical protein
MEQQEETQVQEPIESAVDPRDAELASLRESNRNYEQTFERLKPYEEDIRYIVESDEDYRNYNRDTRKFYETNRAEQKKVTEETNALDPASQKIVDAFYDRVKGPLEYVAKMQERETPEYAQTKLNEQTKVDFQKAQMEYANRLISEQGLSESDVLEVGAYAKTLNELNGGTKFVTLEDAYKKMYSRSTPKSAPSAPRSLRAHAATPGIPGNSRTEVDPDLKYQKGGFAKAALQAAKANRKG